MIVADTNLIAALLLKTQSSDTAEMVWRKDSLWYAPVLWLSEFRSITLKYYRTRMASLEDCEQAVSQAKLAIPPRQTVPTDDIVALQIAARFGLRAYDAEFAALAEILDVPLLTWDRQLLAQFAPRAVSPEQFLAR